MTPVSSSPTPASPVPPASPASPEQPSSASPLDAWPLRLVPGQDLRRALEHAVAARGAGAAFVVAGIGSLRPACIRMAGAAEPTRLDVDLELLTLSGTVSPDGAHLHLSVSDPEGRVTGGHAAYGCIVRTTAEVLVAMLPAWRFDREPDAGTGWAELVARRVE